MYSGGFRLRYVAIMVDGSIELLRGGIEDPTTFSSIREAQDREPLFSSVFIVNPEGETRLGFTYSGKAASAGSFARSLEAILPPTKGEATS